jgi:uncharacterized protein YndB with AHSA1/START domain
METTQQTRITVENVIKAPVQKVWKFYTVPGHITQWCSASDDWHAPRAENDLRTGGKFLTRMEAKDGSFGFDFGGIYDEVVTNKLIRYSLGDEREVIVKFAENGNETKVIVTFDAEKINSIDMQKGGWQAILDNFKKYTEAN